jgi:hypothetical protein
MSFMHASNAITVCEGSIVHNLQTLYVLVYVCLGFTLFEYISHIWLVILFVLYMIYMQYSILQGSKDATKKVGGWKPLASHIRVGRSKKFLKSGYEEDNRTGIKSGDPEHGAPSNEAKASLLNHFLESKEHPTKKENPVKKAGSKKVFTLKGKKKIFKAKQPRKKRRLQALWFYLVAAFDQ